MNIKESILENIKQKKLTAHALRTSMCIKGGKAKAAFFTALKELTENGQIYLDEEGYYQVPLEKRNLIEGIIHISKTGHGKVFIHTEMGKDKYMINENNLNGALDGDTVLISPSNKETTAGYTEAKVEKILKRSTGRAIFEFDGQRLIPHNIYGNIKVVCDENTIKRLVSGTLILINLGSSPIGKVRKKLIFEGQIEEVVGHKDDPNIEEKAIGANHGFLTEFSSAANIEAENIPSYVKEEDLKGRRDLRDLTTFTIDGSHTKDMDDAVSIEVNSKGNYILYVHIADVRHYVKAGSALDKEARARGTSLYMADSVIPMLPHKLSNGICSLNEGVDRLTKTVEMEIDEEGNIVSYDLYDSVINSNKKMTYEMVNQILERGIITDVTYEPFEDDLLIMYLLSETLTKKRQERGNIEFSSSEISVSEDNEDTTFESRNQGAAEKLIENFMILANENVTIHYANQKLPFVYRVHGDPNSDRLLQSLRNLVRDGICGRDVVNLINRIENHKLTSNDLEDFLRKYRGTEIEEIVSSAILTSMSKARYSPVNEGHYGLALDYYTHFTSPIRRYPDLEVHGLIDEYNRENTRDLLQIEEEVTAVCSHSSYMERQADTAEREVLELKMAEYGQEHIGEEYRGQITAFNPYGLDVKLENNLKGVAPLSDIKLPKKSDKFKLQLGQKVYAVIKEVSIPHRAIYFSIVGTDTKGAKKTSKILVPKNVK